MRCGLRWNSRFLDSILVRLHPVASALPDFRRGSNQRYAVFEAAACTLATFLIQSPSFLSFQRRMLEGAARSNRHSLFGV